MAEMFDFLVTEPEDVAERSERHGSFRITDNARQAKNQMRREIRKQHTNNHRER
jgi:hypothetical protein